MALNWRIASVIFFVFNELVFGIKFLEPMSIYMFFNRNYSKDLLVFKGSILLDKQSYLHTYKNRLGYLKKWVIRHEWQTGSGKARGIYNKNSEWINKILRISQWGQICNLKWYICKLKPALFENQLSFTRELVRVTKSLKSWYDGEEKWWTPRITRWDHTCISVPLCSVVNRVSFFLHTVGPKVEQLQKTIISAV